MMEVNVGLGGQPYHPMNGENRLLTLYQKKISGISYLGLRNCCKTTIFLLMVSAIKIEWYMVATLETFSDHPTPTCKHLNLLISSQLRPTSHPMQRHSLNLRQFFVFPKYNILYFIDEVEVLPMFCTYLKRYDIVWIISSKIQLLQNL